MIAAGFLGVQDPRSSLRIETDVASFLEQLARLRAVDTGMGLAGLLRQIERARPSEDSGGPARIGGELVDVDGALVIDLPNLLDDEAARSLEEADLASWLRGTDVRNDRRIVFHEGRRRWMTFGEFRRDPFVRASVGPEDLLRQFREEIREPHHRGRPDGPKEDSGKPVD